jgi:NOL1/NOP2/sun family putative RNA methylase
MRVQLGNDADAYFAAMDETYVRGLRLNPRKPIPAHTVEGLLAPIPWEPNGYELTLDSAAGSHPLHEAGAYYLQEPSAMIPARVLAPKPGERVLDLCAAPGGKSTQLADMLAGSGLLICNEPVPSRAQILSRNLERMGVGNALAVSADPAKLAEKWPRAFDAILVDAPCSGEGMFRRHPETRGEWAESAPPGCAARQQRILESALPMLKPGGRLVYSTCTLNREENEGVIAALLAAHREMSPVDFAVKIGPERALPSQGGMLRVYPHQLRGEGHFIALLRKEAEPSALGTDFRPAQHRLARPGKPILEAYASFSQGQPLPPPTALLGDTLLAAPDLPPLEGVKVLRAGLHLGTLKGKVFAPDHALALALTLPGAEVPLPEQVHPPFPTVPLTLGQAHAWLHGDALTLEDAPHGYVLMTHEGLSLGWGKGSGGQIKNHYPKGLRRANQSEAHLWKPSR